MNWLMQVDHMLLSYLALAITSLLVIMLVILSRLKRQVNEAQKLTKKLDQVMDQVLRIDQETGTYTLRKLGR